MATTITGAWQQRIAQAVNPDIDASGATDVGEAEAQSIMDVHTTKGYFGHAPSEES